MIVLVDVVVAGLVLLAVHRPVIRYFWFAEARRGGRIVLDLTDLRAEHAAQILDDATRDRDLDIVIRTLERQIEASYARHWAWRLRLLRPLILSLYGSEVLEMVTEPGYRARSPYREYGYARLMLAAVVRLGERPALRG